MKKILFAIFLLLLVAGWIYLQLAYQTPATVTVDLEKGSSLRTISHILKQNKVVKNARLFEYTARVSGKSKKIRAGEYEFKQGMKMGSVLQMLVMGRVVLHPVTIPEGFNLRQIGTLAEEKVMGLPTEWMSLVADKGFAQKNGILGETLEGYLFPDTYYLQKRTTAPELAEKMLATFKQKITPELISKAQGLGFNLHQWVSLASIVEKETAVASERPLVASVFLNRLKIGMPLQTDPTVIYGIPNFNGNLTRADLKTDTPYNTYIRPGLPPGPICSPGMNSLMAVLNPASSDYLYFVSRGDGTHYFSKTLEEHNQAVETYQLKKEQPNTRTIKILSPP